MIQVNQNTKTYNTYGLTDTAAAAETTVEASETEDTAAYERLLSGLKTDSLDQWMASGTEYRNKLAKQLQSLQGGSSYLGMALQLKSDLSQVLENGLGSDIAHIRSLGYDPEKISLGMFTRVMETNQKAVNSGSTADIQQELDSRLEAFRNQLSSTKSLDGIISGLNAAQVPVTKGNIEKVQSALDKKEEIGTLSEDETIAALKQGDDLTLDSLYKAKYQTYNTPFATIDYAAIEAQIKEALAAAGMDPVGDLGLAKKILAQGLPLNGETLERSRKINRAMSEWPDEAIIEEAAKNIAQRRAAGDIPLLRANDSVRTAVAEDGAVEALVDQVRTLMPQDVERTAAKGEAINLGTLIAAHRHAEQTAEKAGKGQQAVTADENETEAAVDYNTAQRAAATVTDGFQKLTSEEDMRAIKATLQLEEIRLKLTYESARRLSGKGFSIETAPLDQVVENLRRLEQEKHAAYLQIHQVPADTQNLEAVSDVMDRLNTLTGISEVTLAKAVGRQIPFTIGALSDDSLKESAFSKAMSAYETMETKPRTDLGDRLDKTFGQIGSILKDLGMEENEANTGAVKILARNEMALSVANIEAIKLTAGKVEQLTRNTHPGVIAQMIKDGIAPLSMHVDAVLAYTDQFQEIYGRTTKDQIAAAIYEMDSQATMSQEERESLIGVYRMFSEIDRSQGAAAGFLVKNDLPVNMEQLFEAAKYLKKTASGRAAVEAGIDDRFGLLENLAYSDIQIKDQIARANQSAEAAQANQTNQAARMLEVLEAANCLPTDRQMAVVNALQEMEVPLAHETVLKSLNAAMEIEKVILNQLNGATAPEQSNNQNKDSRVMERFELLEDADVQLMERLAAQGKTGSFQNIRMAMQLQDTPFVLGEKLQNLYASMEGGAKAQKLKKLLEDPWKNDSTSEIDPQHLEDGLEAVLAEAEEGAFEAGLDAGLQVHREINEILDIMGYQDVREEQDESFYQIPMMVNGKLSQVNLYYAPGTDTQRGYDILMRFQTQDGQSARLTLQVSREGIRAEADEGLWGQCLLDEIEGLDTSALVQSENPVTDVYSLVKVLATALDRVAAAKNEPKG